MFNDESTFLVDSKDMRMKCHRRKRERFEDKNIIEILNQGYVSIVVWRDILAAEKSGLDGRVNVEVYIQTVLRDNVLPLLDKLDLIREHLKPRSSDELWQQVLLIWNRLMMTYRL